jgi:hypothetical protein
MQTSILLDAYFRVTLVTPFSRSEMAKYWQFRMDQSFKMIGSLVTLTLSFYICLGFSPAITEPLKHVGRAGGVAQVGRLSA